MIPRPDDFIINKEASVIQGLINFVELKCLAESFCGLAFRFLYRSRYVYGAAHTLLLRVQSGYKILNVVRQSLSTITIMTNRRARRKPESELSRESIRARLWGHQLDDRRNVVEVHIAANVYNEGRAILINWSPPGRIVVGQWALIFRQQ